MTDEIKRKLIRAFGVDGIDVRTYRRLGMVHLLDELILKFDDMDCHKGVTKQHIRALRDDLYALREGAAQRAGIKQRVMRGR